MVVVIVAVVINYSNTNSSLLFNRTAQVRHPLFFVRHPPLEELNIVTKKLSVRSACGDVTVIEQLV